MTILRIEGAIDVCEEHLRQSGAFNTEIEAYLTRYLLILISAEIENHIKELVKKRAEKSNDPGLISFVESAIGQLCRSVKSSEMAGILGRFGVINKGRFQEKMKEYQTEESYFNNIIVGRHDTAHSIGSNISFTELAKFYRESQIVLIAFEEELSRV